MNQLNQTDTPNPGKVVMPWGIQQVQPGSMKTISESKLTTFAIGQQKKSRFQKAREEAEEKQRQEDEETAKVYDSFVASFQAGEPARKPGKSTPFGRQNEIKSKIETTKKIEKSTLFNPQFEEPTHNVQSRFNNNKAIGSDMAKLLEDFKVLYMIPNIM